VSVPVLSVQRTSMLPRFSIAFKVAAEKAGPPRPASSLRTQPPTLCPQPVQNLALAPRAVPQAVRSRPAPRSRPRPTSPARGRTWPFASGRNAARLPSSSGRRAGGPRRRSCSFPARSTLDSFCPSSARRARTTTSGTSPPPRFVRAEADLHELVHVLAAPGNPAEDRLELLVEEEDPLVRPVDVAMRAGEKNWKNSARGAWNIVCPLHPPRGGRSRAPDERLRYTPGES
jgi:hypothetical protein